MQRYLDPSDAESAQALLIRHAKREPIRRGDSVWVAALTDEGREDARRYGETLRPFAFGGVYSSPVPRCLETARLLVEGWGYADAAVRTEQFLLSAYVSNPSLAKNLFADSDPFQLILDQLDEDALPGFHTLENGSCAILNEIEGRATAGALTLFVTHDALIMPFRAFFLGDAYHRDSWLPFLGNAAIVLRKEGVFIDGKHVER